jgi:hypothetical protein
MFKPFLLLWLSGMDAQMFGMRWGALGAGSLAGSGLSSTRFTSWVGLHGRPDVNARLGCAEHR